MSEIRISIDLPVPPEHAFAGFIDLDAWWPREYTWSGEVLDRVAMEVGEGGHCIEWGPHEFRYDWGRVLRWDPPTRLLFTWQIGPDRTPQPDPARASEVEVTVAQVGEGSRVTVVHRHFDRHGDGADDYRAGLANPGGWPYMLEAFARSVG